MVCVGCLQGTLLASCSDDRTLSIWRYPEPSKRLLVDTEHVCSLATLAFSIPGSVSL